MARQSLEDRPVSTGFLNTPEKRAKIFIPTLF